ncbi:MAG: glutamate--tRNA ligase [Mariprofundaceae bacterium]|nr:glutamate--tRNA ligase [Mariprofundaceae bacterium]
MTTIRTRFAPSPTGMLHIGGARTALFSWLYARHHGGEFFLRIEDTDRERSTDEATQVILDGLRWLGLDWDATVVYQSKRQASHVQAVEKLLREGKAYRCYCSRETLDVMREKQRIAGVKPMYDARCRELHKHEDDASPFVVRFCSPSDGETIVDDAVLGLVAFPNQELDDLIIMRSDGSPTYNLAVVVDDAAMGITHVIRGSDHLNNTPRQIQLYQALGLSVPTFAHIPLIHGADGAKMSKRHGAVAITEYREAGCLSSAVVNYLARLGWSHGDDEFFSMGQLIDYFDLSHVGASPSRFDQKKLDWLNAQHLRHAPIATLSPLLQQALELPHANIQPPLSDVIASLQARCKNLHDLTKGAHFFYFPPKDYDAKALKKNITDETWPLLQLFISEAEAMPTWDATALHQLIAGICERHALSMGKLAQPIRIFLAGVPVSPPIDITLALLGKEVSLQRLKRAIHVLHEASL